MSFRNSGRPPTGLEILMPDSDGRGSAEPKAVVRAYAAMGFAEQPFLQQVFLARCYSMEEVAALARAHQPQWQFAPPGVSVATADKE